MKKINLLDETISVIKINGKAIHEIIFIGSSYSNHSCTWKEFKILANRKYDPGYGGVGVVHDLVIYFADGSSMHRFDYDGSGGWVFNHAFNIPEKTEKIKDLFGCRYIEDGNN